MCTPLWYRGGGLRLALGCAAAVLAAACGDGPGSPSDHVASIAIINAPTQALLGIPFTTLPIVELHDDRGRVVAAAGVTVTASVSTGTLSGTTSVVTDARGRAKFTDLAIDGSVGEAELRFSCCGLDPATRTVSLSLGEASIERLDPESISGIAGATLGPAARVLVSDERHKPRAGAEVRFEFDSGATLPGVSVTTGDDGVAALPSVRLPELPSTTQLRATDIATGKSVHYTLLATIRGEAYTSDDLVTAISVGTSVALPRVRVTNGEPVAGALVRYHVSSGDGVLSITDARTGTDGWTEPVTLSSSARGVTVVDMIAVGYSAHPIVTSVVAVVPPLSFEYAGPCTTGCPATFDFTWSTDNDLNPAFWIRVKDAEGAVPSCPIDLTTAPSSGSIYSVYGDWQFQIPPQQLVTGDDGSAVFVWMLPKGLGSYSFTIGGAMFEAPWTYTATVQ